MKKLQWHDGLSLGIARIDDEHRQMLVIANALINACGRGRGPQVVDGVLAKLREYTVYHFGDEESYMKEVGYPGLFEHVHEHNRLKQQVKDYRRDLYKRMSVDPEEVRLFLKSWLLDHILGEDMKIAAYVKDLKKAPAGATRRGRGLGGFWAGGG